MYQENQTLEQFKELKTETINHYNKIYKRSAMKGTHSKELQIFYISSKYETTKIVYNESYKTITMKNIYAYELHEISLLQAELERVENK